MLSTEDQAAKQRPMGVTIAVVLMAIYASILIVGMVAAYTHPQMFGPDNSPLRHDVGFLIVVMAPLRAAMVIVLAFGIWQLQDWARRGATLLGGLRLLLIAFALLRPQANAAHVQTSVASPAVVVTFLFIFVVLGILNHPAIANAFTEAKV